MTFYGLKYSEWANCQKHKGFVGILGNESFPVFQIDDRVLAKCVYTDYWLLH